MRITRANTAVLLAAVVALAFGAGAQADVVIDTVPVGSRRDASNSPNCPVIHYLPNR